MVSRDEFIKASRLKQRMQNRWAYLFIASLGLGATGLAAAVGKLGEGFDRLQGIGIVAALVVAWTVVSIWLVRKSCKYDLACPACGKSLLGLSNQVVIASGRCGHCGARILEDAD